MSTLGRIIGATALFLTVGCGRAAPDEEEPPAVERQIEALSIELEWSRGGPVEDSVLYQPWEVQANADHVVVLDKGGFRVRAFDAKTGDVAWSVGRRGQGPMEFSSPTDLFWDGEGWGVWDDRNARLTFLDSQGGLRRERVVGSEEVPSRFCTLSPDRFAALLNSDDNAAAIVEPDGAVTAVQGWPWRELSDLYTLQRPARWATDQNGTCVGYLTLSTGFALFTAEGFQPGHRYVEAIEPPEADVQEFAGGVSIGFSEIPTLAVQDAFIHDGELWLLFGGHTEDASRLLDVFDPLDGRYIRSYRLPFGNAQDIARKGDQLFVTRTQEGYPTLEAYRIIEPAANSTASTR